MSNKWISRIVTLLFFGFPAIFFLLSMIYGTVPAAFEHWFTAKDRAEQRGLYSIIGDQEVSKIATKYISGSMVCIDSFNESELPMEFEQVWVRSQPSANDIPLRGLVNLSTGWDSWGKNGFSKEVPPKSCDMQNEQLTDPVITNKMRSVTATCKRSAKVSQIVRQTLYSSFWIRSESDDYLDEAYVETQYDVDCDLNVSEVRDCLPRNYGEKLRAFLLHDHDFGAFTEYNYCENPENTEFKRQVLDKWERSRKLKEASDEG